MTNDLTAIRAQMEALEGFTPGPWSVSINDAGGKWTGWPLSIGSDNIEDKAIVRPGGHWPYEWDAKTSRHEACKNAQLIAAAPEMRATILAICDALDEAREAATVRQQNARDTFDAMVAMRDSINEHIPMPSLESDLAQGPKHSVFCAVVAEAVIGEVGKLRAENERLRAALKSLVDLNDNYSPFGGEIYQDRIERTWNSARAALGQEGDA